MKVFFISLSLIVFLACGAATNTITDTTSNSNNQRRPYIIGSYNVENLFDTKDDPSTEDEWFLPTSSTQWDDKKYETKLNHLAKVIDAMNASSGGPDIIGLCEVENKSVVEDLSNQQALKDNHYEIVHYESPDTRGIDVAAMYDGTKFKLISSRSINVPMPEDNNIKTRDILYCQFEALESGNILHFYVNHWSSRRGGEEETFFKRKNCATALLKDLNEHVASWNEQTIIMVGDFNDYPTDKSIYDVLGAKETAENTKLFNLTYDLEKNGKGTYNHKGDWGCLDNIIITSAAAKHITEPVEILKEDWMLYTNKKGEQYPNRTYGGSNYYGGYSDHLPVYFSIEL